MFPQKIKEIWQKHPWIKFTVGIILIVIGFISWITPLTPFGFVLFIGLQMIGVKLAIVDKIINHFKKKDSKIDNTNQ